MSRQPAREADDLIAEQVGYYRARAPEYEEWWFRRGRYDHGVEANERWKLDAERVERALDRFRPQGDVLEIACGTGLWTQKLLSSADHVTAIDVSPEMLTLHRRRVGDRRVRRVEANVFDWWPDRRYDVCFFAFWLSHVPEERFADFWDLVGRTLSPGGRVFFVDSARSDRASAGDHQLPDHGEQLMVRRLNDGRTFRIVKHFFGPARLARSLDALGWEIEVSKTAEFFIYGSGERSRAPDGDGFSCTRTR